MHKKARFVMLGVLCAGLLLIGVGVGVLGVEFSQFTYGGTKFPEGEISRKVETFQLEAGNAPVWVQSYLCYPNTNVETLAEVKVSEDLEPGMVQVAVSYRKIPGMEIWISSSMNQENGYITLSQHQTSPMAMLLSYKDWMLKDLKNREWCEYASLFVDAVEITVNPADKERIRLSGEPVPTMEYAVDDTSVYEDQSPVEEYSTSATDAELEPAMM